MGRARAADVNWAVFLDRDGVLNRSLVRDGRPYAPMSLDEFELLPGVGAALGSLTGAGAKLIVVTNQPDVGKGIMPRTTLDAMHRKLLDELPIDEIRVCCHTDEDGCTCRKPQPGLLLGAARENEIDLGRSYMVGDRWRDIEAGRAAGCRTVFVDYGYTEARPTAPDYIVASLVEAASLIVNDMQGRAEAR